MGRICNPKSQSPGLAVHTLAMCEISYGEHKQSFYTSASSSAAPTTAAPPPTQRAQSGRRRRINPAGGFNAGAAAAAEAEDGDQAPVLDELMHLDGANEAADCDARRDFLKERFDNRASNVLGVLKLSGGFRQGLLSSV
eukprot:1098595-Pleurochrysis_carterae.AAC.4